MTSGDPGRIARPFHALRLARRFAPYVIVVLALGWVLRQTDLQALYTALRHAPIGLFVGVSAVMLVLNCAADTFAMGSVFSWFGCRVPFRDLFVLRASTYLLAVVNYHVGQAAIVGYLYRVKRMPLLRASGCILFIIGINVGVLFLLAAAGASNASGELAWLRVIPLGCAVGVTAYAALLLARPQVIARRRLFAPLFEMGLIGHVKGVLVRLPHIAVLLLWHFTAQRMFGIELTPLGALLYLPAYFAVSSLPVNINGIGVAQVVAVACFAPFVPVPPGAADPAAAQKAVVMAYSLSASGISILLQLLLGMLCLRRGTALGLARAPVDSASPLTEAVASAAAPSSQS